MRNNILRLAYTVTTTTNCHKTGPRVSKDANRNMCLLLSDPKHPANHDFFKLATQAIQQNNRNKAINYIFIWNLANLKK